MLILEHEHLCEVHNSAAGGIVMGAGAAGALTLCFAASVEIVYSCLSRQGDTRVQCCV
jgi:hypothetical protein